MSVELIILCGFLGSGKTTLTRGLGAGLRVRGAVTSPTFVIARLHPVASGADGGVPLLHVDAYRLGSFAELDDLDLDASLADCVTVVEWGEGIAEPLSPDRLEVAIERAVGDADTGGAVGDGPDGDGGDEARIVVVRGVGARWDGVALPTGGLPAAD